MDEPAGGVAADLARVERDCTDELGGGVLNVDIFEDDGGAFATEFEFRRNQILSASFGDEAPDFGRAGEAHAAQAGVAGEGGAGGWAEAGDDVDHAIGDADFFCQAAKIDGGERVSSAGLMTTVLPAARAGAMPQPIRRNGKFQGKM